MRPELIIGLVGPIGCEITAVEKALEAAFKQVDYKTKGIRLSEGIAELLEENIGTRPALRTLSEKIEAGNRVRRTYNKKGILAAFSIAQIRELRASINTPVDAKSATGADPSALPADAVAYIIRQFKRPEEIELMRKTYGRAFIQVSIAQERNARISNLVSRLGRECPEMKPEERDETARRLVRQDEDEETDVFGQRLTKIFHLADAFIDARDEAAISSTTTRFINALFGRNNIAPTKDEFGSHLAKAASLRSVDLSRQVGAAIVSNDGDLVAIGCNEVPKPFGGNYWDEDKNKKRDIDKGGEANKEETDRIIYDFLRILSENGVFKDDRGVKEILSDDNLRDAINESMIGEITEYGRMVHAEMNAISDAARLGRAVSGATLYVTTFPCHNCAKHIIAAGISRVVYIEPYPKSRTELLYGDLVSIGDREDGKVEFSHFAGISPSRFTDIFEKSRRRDRKTGLVQDWYQDRCSPRIGEQVINYTESELHAINDNFPSEVHAG